MKEVLKIVETDATDNGGHLSLQKHYSKQSSSGGKNDSK